MVDTKEPISNQELKACPGCGSMDIKKLTGDLTGQAKFLECQCGWAGPIRTTHEEAIEAWNRRATTYAQEEQGLREALKAAIECHEAAERGDTTYFPIEQMRSALSHSPAPKVCQKCNGSGIAPGFCYKKCSCQARKCACGAKAGEEHNGAYRGTHFEPKVKL